MITRQRGVLAGSVVFALLLLVLVLSSLNSSTGSASPAVLLLPVLLVLGSVVAGIVLYMIHKSRSKIAEATQAHRASIATEFAPADQGAAPLLLIKDGEVQPDFDDQVRASMEDVIRAIRREGGAEVTDAKAVVLLAGGAFVVELKP